MISPKELHHLVVKLFVIVLSITGVDNQVVVFTVLELHEPRDIVDGIPVSLLQT